jgi:5'-3' exonuclease
MHFEELRSKKIAVDVSIYMYRFLADVALLENMYLMASILRHYDIHGIFVFDGPPPVQKTELIELRKKKKEPAKKQYKQMERIRPTKRADSALSSSPASTHEILEIEETMTQLKKQFIHIRDSDIANVKDLLASFGFAIVDAEGEADALCAKLAIKRRVFACMSDDMDMFLYGCSRVLRNLSLMNHRVMYYDTSNILKDLGMTYADFLEIMVLCGTDYNTGYVSLRKTLELHNEYKNTTDLIVYESKEPFYHWFIKKLHFNETDNFTNICSMFDISGQTVLENFSNRFKMDILEKKANVPKIKEIMTIYGFLFP